MHPKTANTILYILIHLGWFIGFMAMWLAIANLGTGNMIQHYKEVSLMPGVTFVPFLRSDYHRFLLANILTGMFWIAMWFMGMEKWLKGIYLNAEGTKWE